MKKNRREFIQLLQSAFWSFLFFPISRVQAASDVIKAPESIAKIPDLVAVKDGSPTQMFEIGIKAFGGMERFVKKGQTVLVKPNIGWNKKPELGANTNPGLTGKIIKMAYDAGAKQVNVFDHTCNKESQCYKNSGIEEAVRKNNGIIHSGGKKRLYNLVDIPNAKVLKQALVHKLYLDADVIINVPILKTHGGGRMTSAMKNLMGVVWDRGFWHKNGLHECIADFPLVEKKVNLSVIDAFTVMKSNGPRGISFSDLVLKRMQVLSTDMVLADTACAKILGMDPNDIPYLKMAENLGYGTMNLEGSSIKRISCSS
jgi:uncharacterized protein (DUF362 family)